MHAQTFLNTPYFLIFERTYEVTINLCNKKLIKNVNFKLVGLRICIAGRCRKSMAPSGNVAECSNPSLLQLFCLRAEHMLTFRVRHRVLFYRVWVLNKFIEAFLSVLFL